jgi:hypothetical protein
LTKKEQDDISLVKTRQILSEILEMMRKLHLFIAF